MGMGKKLADASAKILSLENRLSGTLKPASLVNQVANWHILAILVAGLLSLAVFLAMVARALFVLYGKKRTA